MLSNFLEQYKNVILVSSGPDITILEEKHCSPESVAAKFKALLDISKFLLDVINNSQIFKHEEELSSLY